MVKHKHHIVPRHMGGTDDSSNLVELTVEEHAEAHRILFEKHGQWEDYLAWQGLAKLIPKQQLVKKIQSESAKKNLRINGNPFYGKRTRYNLADNEEHRKLVSEKASTPQAIEKRKKTFATIHHQQGMKNSQYGTLWVCHSEHGVKKIKKEDLQEYLSLGYIKGRKNSLKVEI